jgi:hypothetical protein
MPRIEGTAAIASGDPESAGPDVLRVMWDGRESILSVDLFHTGTISRSFEAHHFLEDETFRSNAEAQPS